MEDRPSSNDTSVPDETTRRNALLLRTLPILLIPILVTLITFALIRLSLGGQFVLPDDRSEPPGALLIRIVVLVVFFSALIILVRIRRPTLTAVILIAVWTLLTTVAALQSGVTSYFPALLIIPICVAGLLIDGVASISLAVLSTLLVGSLAWLEGQGLTRAEVLPPLLAEYQSYIAAGFWIAIFATVGALTWLLSGGLQRALRQSRNQAHALQELSQHLEARVETQTAQLLHKEREAATLEERTRLAREIHDTLAQGLTGIVVQLGAAQRALLAHSEAVDQHIDLAQQMAREALAEARRSVWNLRAPVLERGDLADALRTLSSRPIRPETEISFTQRGEPWVLPPDVESALLRVYQEALVNVAKHTDAIHVTVLLEYTADAVRLSVSDDGMGFDDLVLPQEGVAPAPWGGFGLLGMRERLAALGGTLELSNNGGAHVLAVVPRERSEIKSQTSA